MKQTYEELERERNELAAQVDSLRSAILNAIQFIPGGNVKANLRDAYDETPPAALAALKVQCQADGVLKFAGHAMVKYRYDFCDWAKLFANELRQHTQEPNNANPNNPPA